MFPLFSSSADTTKNGKCTHSDADRRIVDTWVVHEVRKAVEMGYVVVTI
jgi:hypothetical protein